MTHNTFQCSFNDDMEQKQIAEHLKHWKRLHTDLMWVYEAMSRLTGAMPDCKLMRPVFEVWAAYTEAVGKLIGDRCAWLQWYELECDMGKRPLVAVFPDGVEREVRTLRNLAQLIADEHNA